ncbi:hypothetical protein GCM10022420_083880 [Streptomyces iranensis]
MASFHRMPPARGQICGVVWITRGPLIIAASGGSWAGRAESGRVIAVTFRAPGAPSTPVAGAAIGTMRSAPIAG